MHLPVSKETSVRSKSIAKEFQEHRLRAGGKGGYPPELRRDAVSLMHAGHSPLKIAKDLKVTPQTLHAWKRQQRQKVPDRPEPRRLSVVPELTSKDASYVEAATQNLRFRLPGGMELSLARSDLDSALLRALKEVWPC